MTTETGLYTRPGPGRVLRLGGRRLRPLPADLSGRADQRPGRARPRTGSSTSACGTGKVAVPLLACGISRAGRGGRPADGGRRAQPRHRSSRWRAFETWDDAGPHLRPDHLRAGLALDRPGDGPGKAARLLNPGGTLALFWNLDRFDAGRAGRLDEAYAEHAPELVATRRPRGTRDDAGHVAAARDAAGSPRSRPDELPLDLDGRPPEQFIGALRHLQRPPALAGRAPARPCSGRSARA